MEITYLGDKLEDGVLASISIGINLKASYDINDMFGGGGGGFPGFPGGLPGNFSFPSEWLSLLPSGISFPPGGLPSGFPSGVFPFPRPTSGVASTSTDLSTTPAPASSTLPTSTAAPPKTKSTKTKKPRPTWRPKWFRPGHPGHHGHH